MRSDRARHARLALAWVLLLGGVFFLVGCFYVPRLGKPRLHNQSADIPTPDQRVGSPDEHRELTLGHSTLDDVTRVFPITGGIDSTRVSHDRRYAIVPYSVVDGYWVYPLCFTGYASAETRYLRLNFDPDGRLTAYDTFDDPRVAMRGTSFENPPRPAGAATPR